MKNRKAIPVATFVCCRLQRELSSWTRGRAKAEEKMRAISNQASSPKRNLNEAVKESSKKQPISVTHWPLLAEIHYSMRDILL
jgi:hypothetical protein